jgi:hypothetical protein
VGYNQEITQKFSPVAGFQLLLNNSRFSRSLWLNLGASADYQSFSSAFTSTLTTAVQTQVTVRTNTNYEAIMLRLPLLLRLGRPQGVVRPYVEAGVAANFPVEQKNSIVNVGYGPSGEHQWLGSSSLFYPSFIGSVGLDVDRPNCHRIGVAMRYEGGRGPSNLIYTTTKITSGQLLFTYALGK